MKVIPVIDIKSGQAVLAKQGNRLNYQPLSTPLCASSDPKTVIRAFLSVWGFKKIYIADLDSLMAVGDNTECINSLFKSFPEINFIIDCGKIMPHYSPFRTAQYQAILGTESFSAEALSGVNKNFILSLDFSANNLAMGDSTLYNTPQLWPKELIIMTLALVGKNHGADFKKIAYYHQHYPDHNFIAAGGIRNIEDLKQLERIGIQQVLVASALHNKQLKKEDLHYFL